MKFQFAPHGAERAHDPGTAIGCDGLPEARVCLSHWPGNTTPRDLRRDLSTGIALAYVGLDEEERRARFGFVDTAVNDHFDTDGLLAVFTCLDPAAALKHAEALLLAAAAGDHWRAPTPRALAFDLAVSCFTDPARSPLGSALTPLTGPQRDAAAYAELLGRLPRALDDPWSLGAAIEDEEARVVGDLRRLRTGAAKVSFEPRLHLAVVECRDEFDPRAVFEVCATDRVLVLRQSSQELYAVLHVSALSWFESSAERFPARPNLARLASRLQALEREQGEWVASDPREPFPKLEFGHRVLAAGVRDSSVEARPTSLGAAEILAVVKGEL